MTKLETLIIEAKATLASNALGVIGKSRLSTAINEAESARAAFCDVKNAFGTFILAIERTLETGADLSFHAFNDPHYSKVTTCCNAARFRRAWRDLEVIKANAEREIEEFRAVLARV